jgi:hypothetical protein
VFVLVITERDMMCPAIGNPASSEVNMVIRFLRAKNINAAEFHRELCAIYAQNIMDERTERQCRSIFKDGRPDVHNEEQSGQPSVVSDDLIQSVHQKIRVLERRRFIISELSCEFP